LGLPVVNYYIINHAKLSVFHQTSKDEAQRRVSHQMRALTKERDWISFASNHLSFQVADGRFAGMTTHTSFVASTLDHDQQDSCWCHFRLVIARRKSCIACEHRISSLVIVNSFRTFLRCNASRPLPDLAHTVNLGKFRDPFWPVAARRYLVSNLQSSVTPTDAHFPARLKTPTKPSSLPSP
jgi:hypothetical protein